MRERSRQHASETHVSIRSGVFVSVTGEIRNTTIEILDSRICAIRRQYWEPMLYYMAVTTFLVFVVPIIVISVLYVFMGITLYKASRCPSHDEARRMNDEHIRFRHHPGQRVHFWTRQNTESMIKSRPLRTSRRAVLKMLGKRASDIDNDERPFDSLLL